MKHLLRVAVVVLFALLIIVPSLPTVAQQPPAAFNDALADLGRRLGRTLTPEDFDNPTSRWEWRGVDYADNTLECPRAGETVVPGTVIGYQIILIYRGTQYDYRVAESDRSTLRLCTNATGATFDVTLPPAATANPDPPEVFNTALADLAERLGEELTLETFDQPGWRWAWRYREFRNSQLDCPRAGQQTDQVITPGWQFTFVVRGLAYDYRATLEDPSTLFLCRGTFR